MNAILHSDAGLGNGSTSGWHWTALASERSSGTLKYLVLGIVSLFVLNSAQAVLTTVTYTPNPVDLNDLDHHSLYTWRIDNLPDATIIDATLNFKNIRNWDTNTNKLHIHLLDTAIFPGVAVFIDDLTASVPVTDLTDDFSSTRFHNDQLNLRGPWLVASGTADYKLGAPSFTTTPVDYNYVFSSTQNVTAWGKLKTFAQNGRNIAFGFDPDCHYFNDGISFTITFDLPSASPVPEVSAFFPLSAILGLAIGVQAWTRRRSQVQVATEA
jgi:hypothetical protein